MRESLKLYFVFRNPDDPDWSEKKKKKGLIKLSMVSCLLDFHAKSHVPWFVVHCIVVYLPFPVPVQIHHQ
jgi:hypothetical protein